MGDISKWLARAAFYIMIVILLAWTMTLTLAFVGRALPDQQLAPYFALIVFDAGMLTWLFVFLKYATGIQQRSLAFGMSIFDLIGVGVMVIAELLTGGQSFVEVPADVGAIALWTIGVWTFLNVAATILFHLFDPHARHAMALRAIEDEMEEGALDVLQKNMKEMQTQVAGRMGNRLTRQALINLLGTAEQHNSPPPQLPAPPQPAVSAFAAEGPALPRPSRCLHVMGNGRHCKRKAGPNSQYCAQHRAKHE